MKSHHTRLMLGLVAAWLTFPCFGNRKWLVAADDSDRDSDQNRDIPDDANQFNCDIPQDKIGSQKVYTYDQWYPGIPIDELANIIEEDWSAIKHPFTINIVSVNDKPKFVRFNITVYNTSISSHELRDLYLKCHSITDKLYRLYRYSYNCSCISCPSDEMCQKESNEPFFQCKAKKQNDVTQSERCKAAVSAARRNASMTTLQTLVAKSTTSTSTLVPVTASLTTKVTPTSPFRTSSTAPAVTEIKEELPPDANITTSNVDQSNPTTINTPTTTTATTKTSTKTMVTSQKADAARPVTHTFDQQFTAKVMQSNEKFIEELTSIWGKIYELINEKSQSISNEVVSKTNNVVRYKVKVANRSVSTKGLASLFNKVAASHPRYVDVLVGSSKPYVDGCPAARLQCGTHAHCETVLGRTKCTCEPGFDGDPIVACVGFCGATNFGNLHFGQTWGGIPAYSAESCPNGTPLASILCETELNGSAQFHVEDLVKINCNKTIAEAILELNSQTWTMTDANVEVAFSRLTLLTSNSTQLTSQDASSVAGFIQNVAARVENNQNQLTSDAFQTVVSLTSQIALGPLRHEVEGNVTAMAQQRKLGSSLSLSLSGLAMRTNLATNESQTDVETDAIFVHVENRKPWNESGALNFQPILRSYANQKFTSPVKVHVPASAVRQAWDLQKQQQNPALSNERRAALIFYKDDQLFESSEKASFVVSIDVGIGVTLRDLHQPISIKHLGVEKTFGKASVPGNRFMVNKTWMVCKYWDYSSESWKSDGCFLNASSATPECLCNHLTNFAILVRSDLAPADVALSVAGDVGVIVSIVAMVFTAVVIAISADLRKHRSGKILIQVCCTMSVAYLAFVCGVSQTSNEAGCIFVAAMLNYFLLVAKCWMAIYSYDMYISLVKVFGSYRTRFLLKCSLFSYGVPALVVITNLAVAIGYVDQQETQILYQQDNPLTRSSYIAENMCWLAGYPLYFGFLLPVAILLLYNCAIFVLVTYELNHNTKEAHSNLRRTAKQSLLLAVTMLVVMGITWISAYFMLLSDDETYLTVTSWIFTIFCAFQGVAIFLLTTLRRADMRRVWLAPLQRCFKRSRPSRSSTNGRKTTLTPVSPGKSSQITSSNGVTSSHAAVTPKADANVCSITR